MNKFLLTLLIITLSLFCLNVKSQVLPKNRRVDWKLAGLKPPQETNSTKYHVSDYGLKGDGISPNDSAFKELLNLINGRPALVLFPEGNFLFKNTISLSNDLVLRGEGSQKTTITSNLTGTFSHSFSIIGETKFNDTTLFNQSASKGDSSIELSPGHSLSNGDWIHLIKNDSQLVTSNWALQTVGQIVKIKSVSNNIVILESALRLDYPMSDSPFLRKITPNENVGIECLKAVRIDNDAPNQSSIIYLKYAANCWFRGIESENCTFSHFEATASSNLYVSNSYFHHGFEYGSGGRAYGVLLDSTSNECLIENNIFEHLRHSMLVQAGANGNVFAYNYSIDPFWDTNPNNSAGDMVLHGNYPYSNLFEHNICQNIVIDNSHGPNGTNNTFLRNRADGFGIFFSASNSPHQNFIGNEITNTNFPFSLVNYSISGADHFLYGNNNKGTIDPQNTEILTDLSYVYTKRPSFIEAKHFASLGTPNIMGSGSNPANQMYTATGKLELSCQNNITISNPDFNPVLESEILLFPNPNKGLFHLNLNELSEVNIINSMGQIIQSIETHESSILIDLTNYAKGIYYLNFTQNSQIQVRKIIIH
ncbi:MAG: T9SS type A sorting domain-containing protein [Salibacteraceae bacterium]